MKRVAKELADVQTIASPYYEVFVTENNLLDWKVIMKVCSTEICQ